MRKRDRQDILYIVMPAYNEENNIEDVISEWYQILTYASVKSKLVVAAGGSTDGTGNKLSRLKRDYPQLETIETKYKEHGPKLVELYKYAIENGADYIFQTDSDGQTNPGEFLDFWKNRNISDILLGNRVRRKDGVARKIIEPICPT